MKKFHVLCTLLVVALLTVLPITRAYAEEAAEADETVVISYDRALSLAMTDVIAFIDLDTHIRTMRMQHRDLRYQLDRLVSGEVRREAIEALTESWKALHMGLKQAIEAQQYIDAQIDMALQPVTIVMALLEDELSQLLRGAIEGIIISQTLSGEIAALEASRAIIMSELHALNDPDLFQDAIDEIRRALREIERQILNLRLHQDVIELSMEYALRSILTGIDEIDMGIVALEATMELTNSNLPRMRISYELGFISRNDLRTAEHSLVQGNLQLGDLRRARINIVQSTNNLLGLPLTQNSEITFEIYTPEAPENLERHMENLINNAPSIRQLQIAIDSAIAERRAYSNHDRVFRITANDRRRAMGPAVNNEEIRSLRNRIALQDAVDRAVLAHSQGMRTMEVNLRQAFRELESLSDRLDAQYAELEQARSSLDAAGASLEAGRVTQFEFEQAQLAVLIAKQGIGSIYNQKWLLAFALENPVLL